MKAFKPPHILSLSLTKKKRARTRPRYITKPSPPKKKAKLLLLLTPHLTLKEFWKNSCSNAKEWGVVRFFLLECGARDRIRYVYTRSLFSGGNMGDKKIFFLSILVRLKRINGARLSFFSIFFFFWRGQNFFRFFSIPPFFLCKFIFSLYRPLSLPLQDPKNQTQNPFTYSTHTHTTCLFLQKIQ